MLASKPSFQPRQALGAIPASIVEPVNTAFKLLNVRYIRVDFNSCSSDRQRRPCEEDPKLLLEQLAHP